MMLDHAVPQGHRVCRTYSLITVQETGTLLERMEGLFIRRLFTF